MIAAVTLVIPYTSADWATVVPAFAVAATALVVLVADLLVPRRSRRLVSILLGILGLAASGANAALQWGQVRQHAPAHSPVPARVMLRDQCPA